MAQLKEKNYMAKKGVAPKKPQYEKLDFLKVDDIPERGSIEMKILGNTRTYDGDWGLKINFDVEVKGKKFAFGLKPSNPGLKVIIDSLVARKAIKVERAEYNGHQYVQIAGVPPRGEETPF